MRASSESLNGRIGKAQPRADAFRPLGDDDVAQGTGKQEVAGKRRKQSEHGKRAVGKIGHEPEDQDDRWKVADRVRGGKCQRSKHRAQVQQHTYTASYLSPY